MMLSYQDCLQILETRLKELSLQREPLQLYEPVDYILSIGGKRIRPCLTLMAHNMYSDEITGAIPAALAVEIFHNFTLLHDDIMDNAPTRRNHDTVHERWDENTAILSGDAMMILSYEQLLSLDENSFRQVFKLFNKTALEVCEGQQYDMNFENESRVGVDEYLEMIRLKTAVLIAASLAIGGITAGAGTADVERLYSFGQNLGIAFQLQDDYLDSFAKGTGFGKKIGGDIAANKKTYMLISALNSADNAQVTRLEKWLGAMPRDPEEKILAVRTIFQELGTDRLTRELADRYFTDAMDSLSQIAVPESRKAELKRIVNFLMQREH